MRYLPAGSMPIVLWFQQLRMCRRPVLLESGLPVPYSQICLPPLGIDIKEHPKASVLEREKLSPAVQLILLRMIYWKEGAVSWKADLSKAFSLSPILVDRAVQQLEALELISVRQEGQEAWISPVRTGKALYETARSYLADPVRERVHVRRREEYRAYPFAGETALAERSMLNGPWVDSRAIYFRDFYKPERCGGHRLQLDHLGLQGLHRVGALVVRSQASCRRQGGWM